MAVGTLAGLLIAEAAFWIRDGGAFPHLNVYVADPVLGVRLRPHATELVQFGGNPASSVRINAEGYRGADWGDPSDDELLVVGDSQAFGLGVDESASFESHLEQALGPPARVLNAGVPTYGPLELERVIDEVLAKRHPTTVVYVVNFVNDPFEARRRNIDRHAVWDGWAVRRETAPRAITAFPGRSWLFRESHAVFALRQWLYSRSGFVTLRLPSEGAAEDLVDLSAALSKEREEAARLTDLGADRLDAQTREAALLVINADQRVKEIAVLDFKLTHDPVYLAAGATPGDIVEPSLGENSSPLGASVEYVVRAATLRARIERDLKEKALANAEDEASRSALDALDRRDLLEKRLLELAAAPISVVRATQPIVERALAAKKKVEDKGAKFVLLALPMDVQVSKTEWAKYGTAEIDLEPARVLVRDLVDAVEDAGGVAVDPTDALRAAEPGAFLDHDPHLSPKGHETIARLLADALTHPSRPRAKPRLALPLGRSRVPKPSDWERVGALLVNGSDDAGCTTQRIREWMRVHCVKRSAFSPAPQNVRMVKGGHGEAMTLVYDGAVTLVAPVIAGDDFEARFSWPNGAKDLVIHWPAGVVETERSFVADTDPPDPPTASDLSALCDCLKGSGRRCDEFVGYADKACATTYGSDCSSLVACMEGNPAHPPACGPGETNAGAALHCFATCETRSDCKVGECVDKQGAKLCVSP